MNAPIPIIPPRRIACARCGAPFDCGGDACWCAAEPYRLAMGDAAPPIASARPASATRRKSSGRNARPDNKLACHRL